jgi:long-chain acyl-CoA synthetase
MNSTDVIAYSPVLSIPAAFQERVRRSPAKVAYLQYDDGRQQWIEYSWRETADAVSRWQQALLQEDLNEGDRVAILLRNSWEWVLFDQAALGLGLITVPLYTNDRPENIGYILEDAGVRLLLIEGNDQWLMLQEIREKLQKLDRIITLLPVEQEGWSEKVKNLQEWLPATAGDCQLIDTVKNAEQLATIVYTSGTTGRSKGVMLNHRNILWNAHAGMKSITVFPNDRFLSFLPLSHTLERTLGYYIPVLAGSSIAFARSIPQLAEDLETIRPTILVSVPRIFERVYGKIMEKLENGPAVVRSLFSLAQSTGWRRFLYLQHRANWSPLLLLWPLMDLLVAHKVRSKFGGALRFAVSGGAPLSLDISRLFISLGILIQQGYGLTETSPIISANTLEDNEPSSVGEPLDGVEIGIGENDELLTRSPSVMMGYWNNEEATNAALDEDGWLRTGDKVRLENGHLYITGRLKEIIVLANGEKAAPADMESAISMDKLIEQVLIIGEGKPYLSALVVPNPEKLHEVSEQLGLSPEKEIDLEDPSLNRLVLERISHQLRSFPGYSQVRRVALIQEPWTVENYMMTPTLKLRRNQILKQYSEVVETLYEGHDMQFGKAS